MLTIKYFFKQKSVKTAEDDEKVDEKVDEIIQGIKEMTHKQKMTTRDKVWACLWKKWDLKNHNFEEEPYYFKAKDFSACKKKYEELSKFNASDMEARKLCYLTNREMRPNIFIKNSLSLLPVKNGEYIIIKGDAYVDINEINERKEIPDTEIQAKASFDGETNTISF